MVRRPSVNFDFSKYQKTRERGVRENLANVIGWIDESFFDFDSRSSELAKTKNPLRWEVETNPTTTFTVMVMKILKSKFKIEKSRIGNKSFPAIVIFCENRENKAYKTL